MTEGKFMFYTIAAVFFLLLIHIFQAQILILYNPINYVAFHTVLEFFSISISVSIFLYGWKKFEDSKSRSYLLLSVIFFLVAMTDLLHTITFKGMPHFFTESSIPKATWFWIIARMLESSLILLFLLLPDKKLKHDSRPIILFSCMVFIILMAWSIFYYEDRLPLLVIEGKGTTFLKNTIEYMVSSLHLIAIILTLYRYYIDKKELHLFNALAFTFLFLSELIFTIYQSVYDLDNFSGHILKVIGYYFLMKGFLYYPLSKEKLDHRPNLYASKELSQRSTHWL
jgi:hypothetical protein